VNVSTSTIAGCTGSQLIPLLDAIPPIRGRRGRPRRKPDAVVADRGYDHDKYRILLRHAESGR
jgi:hypothetical protein